MKLSVIIPAYNEAHVVGDVVRDFYANLSDLEVSFEIIIVDDGSIDETQEILARLKKEIPQVCTKRIFQNMGYGNAILEGLKMARGEILGWAPADSQVKASDFVKIYRKLIENKLDLCKAMRVIRDESQFRIVRSKVYNTLFCLLFRVPCGDINGTPKLFRRSLYDSVNLCSRDWFIDPEIVIKTARLGLSIGEVPTRWYSRKAGFSKVRVVTSLEFVKNMLAYRFFNKK